METRGIIRNWPWVGAFAFLVVFVFAGLDRQALFAQTPAAVGDQQGTVKQEPIPADHYDPDDTKTYEDVIREDRQVQIRGRQFTIHFFRPRVGGAAVPAIYACGDGGWRGLAPRTAEQLAHVGFAVAGVDSKVYLREFSSAQDPLTIKTLASDYAEIAGPLREYASVGPRTPVFVYGWSLGAGFAVAVGADADTRPNWAGVIAIGLPAQNQLVSGLSANHADLRDSANSRYGFRTTDVMVELTPVPLVLIESTSDTASPLKVGKALFAAARDPKQYVLIKADNHRFSGARDEFYSALDNAMKWIRQVRAVDAGDQKNGGQR
jgi:dienelactone hydrolase